MFRGDRNDYMEIIPRRSLTTRVTPIVGIELSSIQAIEVVSVARVVLQRLPTQQSGKKQALNILVNNEKEF